MALEYHDRDGAGAHPVTTSCPFCEEPIGEYESVASHIRDDCPEAP